MNSSQFGLKTNCSTELACHTVLGNIYSKIKSGNYTLGVFLHLAKALDPFDRRTFFEKLEHYGIRDVALEWFKSKLQILSIDYGVPKVKSAGIIYLLY